MDMYRDSYVVALMVGGKIQKESDDGTVLIPFGSEYVLRLKNKLRKRAVADIWIDGKIACKGVVVDANGTVDLERFVEDGNLTEGKRFKLARLTDPKVEQPDDSENGGIEVNFYPEKDAPVGEKILEHINCGHHNIHGWSGHCTFCCSCYMCKPQYRTTYSGDIMYGTNIQGGFMGGVVSNGNIQVNNSSDNLKKGILRNASMDMIYTASASVPADSVPMTMNMLSASVGTNIGEAAATVQGSTSNQKFSYISVDVDRSKPTTIHLNIKGTTKIIEVCGCGYKRKNDAKFCPNDGTQLVA